MSDVERPLSGGRTVAGVVRVGETVRRPMSVRSPFAHRVLLRLAEADVGGVPRFLGVDEYGREILSYQAGETAHGRYEWTDEQLVAMVRLVRAIHDALAGTPEAGDAETVCHHDLAPWNTILTAGHPTAVIDFDGAAPGPRADDLAYLLWTFLDLGLSSTSAGEHARLLRLACDAYAADDGPKLHAALLPALRREQERILAFRAAQTDPFSAQKHKDVQTALHWLDAHQRTLEAHLAA
ncbi:phosphotransferase family enzyme [Kribbella amoyensis]|uniref:Phosphotransferase family enzyme n=1 Tax=Kribbella amoyensis TaxID=996641 RepID=A0A561BPZ0_9ACTN|nr:aminoglycoside phosphotransferase family protein [Kribbella amoyensis]TWD80955.1 phosphotransferase family enzyme [Kribbella amoyensis]